jgi:hypothetical protein
MAECRLSGAGGWNYYGRLVREVEPSARLGCGRGLRGEGERFEGDPEDEWRDMSGDALTTREALRRGLHAQCPLATTRNVRRDPSYTRARLAERQIPLPGFE